MRKSASHKSLAYKNSSSSACCRELNRSHAVSSFATEKCLDPRYCPKNFPKKFPRNCHRICPRNFPRYCPTNYPRNRPATVLHLKRDHNCCKKSLRVITSLPRKNTKHSAACFILDGWPCVNSLPKFGGAEPE